MLDESVQERSSFLQYGRAGFDHGVVYQARASNGACLGAYWCGVECACAGREGEEDESDGSRQCSGALCVVTMRVMACTGRPGRASFGQCRARLGPGKVPACVVEWGEAR
jgi:hypothetical protein